MYDIKPSSNQASECKQTRMNNLLQWP